MAAGLHQGTDKRERLFLDQAKVWKSAIMTTTTTTSPVLIDASFGPVQVRLSFPPAFLPFLSLTYPLGMIVLAT
ncbi:hypothetical protein LX36DRAFT_661610 [Colletotrichum falcatum]|nr:hypothetical protein LX36DRAFT_661610 [Colletotrichum falcatum]